MQKLRIISNELYDLELYFEVYKITLLRLFGLANFHGFVGPDRWEDGTYCLPFVLFGHENRSFEYFSKKSYQTWSTTALEALKKNNKMLQQEHKKESNIRILNKYT